MYRCFFRINEISVIKQKKGWNTLRIYQIFSYFTLEKILFSKGVTN